MAANMQKIKLLKLYELLRKETDEAHPISRVELCRRLNEMGISSNVRTLSLDIEAMQENGFEIMSYLKDKEKYYSKYPDSTANYRIDRIDHLTVIEESVMSNEAVARIDGVAEYTEQVFKMFSGELEDVVIQFSKQLIGPVFDKFGEDTPMMSVNDTTCAATVHVQISPPFFGWLAQFGNKMHIISPANVIEQYKAHIQSID